MILIRKMYIYLYIYLSCLIMFFRYGEYIICELLRFIFKGFFDGLGDLQNCEVIKYFVYYYYFIGQIFVEVGVDIEGGVFGGVEWCSVFDYV